MRDSGELNTEEITRNIFKKLVICTKLYRIEYRAEIMFMLKSSKKLVDVIFGDDNLA
jgi:phospholipid N-methyltransferase